MYVFELTQPGDRLDGIEDEGLRSDQESLLELLVKSVEDAAVSLSLFETAAGRSWTRDPDYRETYQSKWDERMGQERRIAAALEFQLPPDLTPKELFYARRDISEKSHILAKRERWQRGDAPESYEIRAPFILAKSCLYALDTIQQSLSLLGKFPGSPAGVDRATSDFTTAFPDLRRLRNSAHHTEDRVQGKKQKAKIDTSPAGGLLMVDFLNGNWLGGTLEDGRIGGVEISASTVGAAQGIVQAALNSYQWAGRPIHFPV